MQIDREAFSKGRLTAKPGNHIVGQTYSTGLHSLGLDNKRDGLVYVPAKYDENIATPIAIMLHGAGGDAQHGMSLIRHLADENNIILVAPESRRGSWDIISYDRFGPDVMFINIALEQVFQKYNIDTSHLAIGGFSDGASYALSLGLSNGNLFTHILAFSPGFFYTVEMIDKPEVFISHGTIDNVLPIDPCSRRIVPRLQKQGYNIIYHEFDGPHIIPPHISQEGVNWFMK